MTISYYQANKEAILDYRKKYYSANKEKIRKYQKEYNEANKEAIIEQQKMYKEANKEAIADYKKRYNEANKEAVIDYKKRYDKQRKTTDPAFKLIANLRTRHNRALRGAASTTEGLGCDSNFFREHIENQWVVGMNWNNYGIGEGQWSLDHKLPLTLYYTQPEPLPDLIHYTNMQPMWHVENVKKGSKI